MYVKRATDELLTDYAAGSLPEPVALAVATHVSLNDGALSDYRMMNAVGGALVTSIDPVPMDAGALDDVLSKLDRPEVPRPAGTSLDEETRRLVPYPLQAYIGTSLHDLAWRKLVSGVEECRLKMTDTDYKVALMRIAAGRAMPKHSHRGTEYTVVLDGAYCDTDGTRLERGDICEAGPDDVHQPVADPQLGCLCLIVMDAPLKLTGFLGALINPFLRH